MRSFAIGVFLIGIFSFAVQETCASPEPVVRFDPQLQGVTRVVFLPGRDDFVIAGTRGFSLWRMSEEGELEFTGQYPSPVWGNSISKVEFSHNGVLMVTLDNSGILEQKIKLWDLRDFDNPQLIGYVPPPEGVEPRPWMNVSATDISLSPDGAHLAVAYSELGIMYDAETFSIIQEFHFNKEEENIWGVFPFYSRVDFSPNGRYLAFAGGSHSGGSRGIFDLYDLQTGEKLVEDHLAETPFDRIFFSPDSKTVRGTVTGVIQIEDDVPDWDFPASCRNWKFDVVSYSPDWNWVISHSYYTGYKSIVRENLAMFCSRKNGKYVILEGRIAPTVSPSGRWAITASYDPERRVSEGLLWDLEAILAESGAEGAEGYR